MPSPKYMCFMIKLSSRGSVLGSGHLTTFRKAKLRRGEGGGGGGL